MTRAKREAILLSKYLGVHTRVCGLKMNDCIFICPSVYVHKDLFIRDAFLRPNLLYAIAQVPHDSATY